jgi:hypothetical protein
VFVLGKRERSRLRLPKVLAAVVVVVLSASAAIALDRPSHEAGTTAASFASASSGGAGGAASSASNGKEPTTAPGGARLDVPASGSGADSAGAPAKIPTPTAATLPKVAPVRSVENPDAVVLLSGSLAPAKAAQLSKLHGIAAIEEVDTGTVELAGAPAVTFGVDPATFRDFTPPASASSDQLWRYLAGGSLVSSYEMASDRALKLGAEQALAPAGATRETVQGWMGAFASIGLPGVDLLVSRAYSSDLGLTPDSGLVVSAPGLTGSALQGELESVLPGAAIELLHPDQLPDNLPGNVLSPQQRASLIAAAMSRVGFPYVWGGAGPNEFDCSGLVQWSYRQAGILMPRTADEQFLTGDHIPLADAQPGDLLFWTYDPNDPGFVDHTAIYLGNGLMVVAPHTGENVQVASVPTADFAGAVAVVLSS